VIPLSPRAEAALTGTLIALGVLLVLVLLTSGG
jgi:hypothetical protein